MPRKHLGAIDCPYAWGSDHPVWLADRIIKGYTIGCSISNHTGLPQAHGLFYLGGRLVLPDAYWIRQMVLPAFHATPFAGHKGVNATCRLIRPDFF